MLAVHSLCQMDFVEVTSGLTHLPKSFFVVVVMYWLPQDWCEQSGEIRGVMIR